MPIQLFDTKEAVPEAHRASAVETKDGKFAASIDDPELGEKGQAALKKERDARRVEKERADAAERALEELDVKVKAAEGKVSDSALAGLRAEFDTKLKAEKDLREKAEATSRTVRKEVLFDALALKSGAIPERLPTMKRDIMHRFDLNDAGDGLVLHDARGNPVVETAEDFLMTTYKKDMGYLYQGTGGSGSGAEQGVGGGGGAESGKAAAIAAGKAAAAVQKAGAAENALAFR